VKFSPLVRIAAAASAIALAALIAACGSGGGGGGGGGCGAYGRACPTPTPIAGTDCSVLGALPTVTIDLNLGLAACNDKTYTSVQAFSIDNVHSQVVKIPVGSNVKFTAGSGAPHTADLLGSSFPGSDTNPATASPANADISSANFSTGSLSMGASSSNYKANVVGIYYVGCHFHYSIGMRTVLIVQ